LIKQETNELKEKFGDERRTEINQEGIKEFREEDLISPPCGNGRHSQ